MKRILMALVAVAMFFSVAMAQEKPVADMTPQEKYEHARTLWRTDREASVALFDAIKDSEELDNNQRAHSYMLTDQQSVEYAKVANELADETSHIRGQALSLLVRDTVGDEQEGYINEMVGLAGQWDNLNPYEVIVIPLLIQRDRKVEAEKIARAVIASPVVTMRHLNTAFQVLDKKEGVTLFIDSLSNHRNRGDFVPKLNEETGKLEGDSIVTRAFDLIAGASDELTIDEAIALNVRIVRNLSMNNPVHRILIEMGTSEIKRLQELKEMIGVK